MKSLKKAVAMVLSISALISSMGSVAAIAEESVLATADSEVYDAMQQVARMESTGEITAEEAEQLEEQLLSVSSTTYYMPFYSTYSTNNISPTTHYLAPLVAKNASLDSGAVYFYLNMNILPTNATSSSRFKVGRTFTSNSSMGSITSSNYSALVKRISAGFNTPTATVGTGTELFTYELGTFDGSDAVTSENMLNRYTCTTPTTVSPSLVLYTAALTNYTAQKCVYSVGDLNRDGIVNSTDVDYLTSYVVHLTVPNPARSASNQELDTAAFQLAADCDGNGTVNIIDSLTLNQYLSGIYSNLPAD